MDYLTLWIIIGLINALYNIQKEWYDHELFGTSTMEIVIDTALKLLLGVILGPIGAVISIYESR